MALSSQTTKILGLDDVFLPDPFHPGGYQHLDPR